MSRRTIFFRMITTTIALVGIIIMQLYWIRNAITLKKEEVDTGAIVILKSLTNRLLSAVYEQAGMPVESKGEGIVNSERISEFIDPATLDSLIREEFSGLKMADGFEYGVYHDESKKFIMGNYTLYKNEILQSHHKVSLTCLCAEEPYSLGVFFPDEGQYILKQMILWLSLTGFFLVVLFVGYAVTLYGLLTSKKLSEMKSDFMNNMTHEFKTPISTISLASEMLNQPNVYNNSEKTKKYAGIIYDENSRLQGLVDRILQITVLEKGHFRLNNKEVDVHAVIEKIINNFSLLARKRDCYILMRLEASRHNIQADRMHFTNILSNLVDNAIKYSGVRPRVSIRTWNSPEGIFISVSDNGIGISPENQKNVFKNLYRIHTGDVHDAKGFGIGLFYVKRMVEMHGGSVMLRSQPGEGSDFTLYFPFGNNHQSSDQ